MSIGPRAMFATRTGRSGTAMTIELKMLALAVVLGLMQVILASHAASLERGYFWTASARDEALPPLSGVAGRLQRAAAKLRRDFSFFRRSRAHRTCCSKPQLDDGVGGPLVFLGARCLCRAVRSRHLSLAFSCVECRHARDPLDPRIAVGLSVTRPIGQDDCAVGFALLLAIVRSLN